MGYIVLTNEEKLNKQQESLDRSVFKLVLDEVKKDRYNFHYVNEMVCKSLKKKKFDAQKYVREQIKKENR